MIQQILTSKNMSTTMDDGHMAILSNKDTHQLYSTEVTYSQ